MCIKGSYVKDKDYLASCETNYAVENKNEDFALYEEYSIGIEDIKTEAKQLLKQGNNNLENKGLFKVKTANQWIDSAKMRTRDWPTESCQACCHNSQMLQAFLEGIWIVVFLLRKRSIIETVAKGMEGLIKRVYSHAVGSGKGS